MTGNQNLQTASIFFLSFVLLVILFEMHSERIKLDHDEGIDINSYNDAYIEMDKLIKSQLSKGQKVKLQWLGTCMDVGWTYLNRLLIDEISSDSNHIIEVQIAMLDHEWPDFDSLNPFWKDLTRNYYNSICRFRDRHSHGNITIALSTYVHMPYYTGLLINGQTLFLGLCEWGNNRYGVRDGKYVLLRRDRGPEAQRRITQFEHWFEYSSLTSSAHTPSA